MEAIGPALVVLLTPVLGTIDWVGFFIITVADWRTANRWRREREARR